MKKLFLFTTCVMITFSFLGCGKTNSEIDNAKIDNTEVQSEETDTDASLDYLLNNCSSIYLEYEYSVESKGATGDFYQLQLNDDIAEFTFRGFIGQGYEERNSDYTKSKFQDLQNIIISLNPTIYDINDYADSNGKIIYETLNPAVLIYGKTSDDSTNARYLLSINDTSQIEDFFNTLKESSDITYSENNTSSSTGYLDNESTNGTPGTDSAQNDTTIITKDYNAVITSGTEITLTSTTDIRSEMNSSSSKVAVAYSGEQLTVIESYDNGWTKVQYGNKEGYIRTDLLQY
ncbi:MAG: SH3 domain-containing protein [Lachnospiraceae bacterium]|nr:SH3 domain-containing protein [Lachnospiraceae bacterium]